MDCDSRERAFHGYHAPDVACLMDVIQEPVP